MYGKTHEKYFKLKEYKKKLGLVVFRKDVIKYMKDNMSKATEVHAMAYPKCNSDRKGAVLDILAKETHIHPHYLDIKLVTITRVTNNTT